ncbi:NADP-dependent oxidoreductase domain-containing protein [Lanmaoa asiatica]|nr:NADP-dependent oxidoreductase domain-containing protein [Lanmaoa asiatica]
MASILLLRDCRMSTFSIFVGTEHSVGAAIRESGIPRKEIFVTTKLPYVYSGMELVSYLKLITSRLYHRWHHPGYVFESIDESLREAGLDYFDLPLNIPGVRIALRLAVVQMKPIPVGQTEGHRRPADPEDPYAIRALEYPTLNETWADLERVLEGGKVRAIGVSNFSIRTLEQLLTTAKVIPAINQVEIHPYLAQADLVKYCKSKGIVVTAYAPTGMSWRLGGGLNDTSQILGYARVRSELTTALAARRCVTSTQLVLAWHLARGCVVIPKSEDEEETKGKFGGKCFLKMSTFSFSWNYPSICRWLRYTLPELDEATTRAVDALDRNERLCNYPNELGMVYGWTMERFGW